MYCNSLRMASPLQGGRNIQKENYAWKIMLLESFKKSAYKVSNTFFKFHSPFQ